MPPIAELIQQGATNFWVFIPTAVLLGALHGLEPGHSKTMMASFIIAVKGSMGQAAILGLCAALSHSLIVWALAAVALKFGNDLIAEQAEPYLMLLSAAVVIGVSIWMFMRTRRDELAAQAHQHAPHQGKIINTGHEIIELEVFEIDVPPRFRLHVYDNVMAAKAVGHHDRIAVQTLRPDGTKQAFELKASGMYLESVDEIPEPHEFDAVVSISQGNHVHRFHVSFTEERHGHAHEVHHHGHHHVADDSVVGDGSYQGAHERAHAEEIKRRFIGQKVTTGQIAMFGLTGGLVPCPASVTILMICLQLKRFTLGAAMVAGFSLGLAISLVSVGVIAAWGAQQVGTRFGRGKFSDLARKMPYLSSGLMALVATLMGIQAVMRLAAN